MLTAEAADRVSRQYRNVMFTFLPWVSSGSSLGCTGIPRRRAGDINPAFLFDLNSVAVRVAGEEFQSRYLRLQV